MKILAIETSCEHASLALLDGGNVLDCVLEGHANHSERLLPSLRALLDSAGVSLSALDAVAYGSGPGAFTGLRLACGVAQGLALGAELGVVPVCSLAALALQGEGEAVLTVTDARMGEVYFAAWRREGDSVREILAPACAPPEAVALPPGDQWFAIGSGLAAYGSRLRLPPERLRASAPDAVPRAADVARLALAVARAGGVVAPEEAAPLYVRDKVALTTAERLARGGRV